MRSTTLKTILAFGLLALSFPGSFLAQQNGSNGDYVLSQNFPNPFYDTTTIKFSLKEDCYVKLYVIEQQSRKKILLVDGDMSRGEHGIIFKASVKTGSGSENHYDYKCIMETYTAGGDLLNKSEINMMQR